MFSTILTLPSCDHEPDEVKSGTCDKDESKPFITGREPKVSEESTSTQCTLWDRIKSFSCDPLSVAVIVVAVLLVILVLPIGILCVLICLCLYGTDGCD